MERSHPDVLIQGSMIIIEELIHLVSPSRRIFTIEARKVQTDRTGVNSPVVPMMTVKVIVLIPVLLSVVTTVPALLPIVTKVLTESPMVRAVWNSKWGMGPLSVVRWTVWTCSILSLENVMKKLSEVIKLLFHQSIKGLLLRKSFSTLFDGFLKLEKTGAIGHGNRAGKREKKKKIWVKEGGKEGSMAALIPTVKVKAFCKNFRR
jgi:hypothetical protein